jgi:cation diffusion facilitator family transporter
VRVDFGDAIVVAVLGLAVNLVSAAMLSHGKGEHHHGEHGAHDHHHQDHNLRAAYLHVLADALTSVLAIVALTAGRYLGWVWLDPAMGIVGAIVIARWSWILIRQTAAVLLDTADDRLMEAIRSAVEEGGEVTVADLHVWRIGPQAHAAIVSAEGPRQADDMIRSRLSGIATLAHVTIEVVERREG